MNFFKSLLLAIIITVSIVYVFGVTGKELFTIQFEMNNEIIEPLTALCISALIAALLLAVTATVMLSVFGGLIFIVLMLFGCIAMLVIGAFWPVLFIAIVAWLLVRETNTKQAV